MSQPSQSPPVTVRMFWDSPQRCSDCLQALVFISESLGRFTCCFPVTLLSSGIGEEPRQQEQAVLAICRLLRCPLCKIPSPPHLQRLLPKLFPFLGICEKQVILKPLHILFLFQVLASTAKGQQQENGLNSFQRSRCRPDVTKCCMPCMHTPASNASNG